MKSRYFSERKFCTKPLKFIKFHPQLLSLGNLVSGWATGVLTAVWGSRLVRDGPLAGQETRYGLLLPGARAILIRDDNGPLGSWSQMESAIQNHSSGSGDGWMKKTFSDPLPSVVPQMKIRWREKAEGVGKNTFRATSIEGWMNIKEIRKALHGKTYKQ